MWDKSGTEVTRRVTRAAGVSETASSAQTPAEAKALPVDSRAVGSNSTGGVRLVPDQPPGRGNRKALPFAGEICRLYAMGYTLEAIRKALAAVGISVSRSTVHREARRQVPTPPLPAAPPHTAASVGPVPSPLQSELHQATGDCNSPRSPVTRKLLGKKDAEAFFTAHEGNPLLPIKEMS